MSSRVRSARLQIEALEDRCTPSAVLQTLPDHTPDPPRGGHALAHVGQHSQERNGNVISAFARHAHGVRVIWGESTIVDGSRIATWALVSPRDQTILAVGVTFSLKMAKNMPEDGSGPAGAFASLEFPALVQETTFFNHLEIQPEPHGHVSPPGSNGTVYSVPHFDFHFYSIPEEEVLSIPAKNPPLPPAYEIPSGYLPAGPSIAEMGRHSSPRSVLFMDKLTAAMVIGYLPDGSRMHFLEPMVSQETLLNKQDFTLDVPRLTTFGREMLYPTQFEATFQGNSWSFVFSGFVAVQ